MWGSAKASRGLFACRDSFGPFILMLLPCMAINLLCYCGISLDGSVQALGQHLWNDPMGTFEAAFVAPTKQAAVICGVFAAFEILLIKIVPGETTYGPITATGHRPEYTNNGLLCYVITVITFLVCTYGYGLFEASIVYDNMLQICSTLQVSAVLLCVFLFIKARVAPSTADVTFSGSIIKDFYAGSELYPRVFGIDIKLFTNCRFGMMGWPVVLLSYAARQAQDGGLSDSMFVSVTLQLVYIAKFFLWESGYMCSIDIMHDNAGWYLCWGCMNWVPFYYTIHTFWLVKHPVTLGLPLALTMLAVGWSCIYINYDADRQRVFFRKTKGKAPIWGSLPGKIVATYTTTDGNPKTNLLLISGWWGLSRHFHYMPELGAALCWGLPALFQGAMPYFYFLFLLPLLVDRASRDDQRCSLKYGKAWDEYRRIVPYKIVPGVY